MKELHISDDFTIEDIHRIREFNYERRKSMTFKEYQADLQKSTEDILNRLLRLKAEKEGTSNIQAIVFDVGKVLIDRKHASQNFVAYFPDNFTWNAFARAIKLYEFGSGEIDKSEFYRLACNVLAKPMTEQEFEHAWTDLDWTVMDDMLSLLLTLKQKYKVYMLTNTIPYHAERHIRELNLYEYAHGAILSNQVGLRKPDSRIYRLAEKTFNLIPEQTVFIDDSKENVQGAINCGWHAVQHRSYQETLAYLQGLGVEV